jgi:hypothetical protein
MRKIPNVLATFLLLTAVACGGDDDDTDGADDGTTDDGTTDDGADDDGSDDDGSGACEVAEWAAPDFADNAAASLALRTQLGELGTLMRAAEQETMTVDDVADLTALYEVGDPSLAATVTDAFDPIVADAFADFVALAGASVQDLIDADGNWTPGPVGGLFGPDTRGINTGGLEVRQLVDKGLFGGAAFYHYALGLTEGEITPATIDAVAAAWGSTGDVLDTKNLDDSAGYGFEMGFYATMIEALTDARSHAADEGCTAERDAALVTFFRAWEQSMVARTIYYANAAVALVAGAPAGNPGDADKSDALHELAEGVGLTLGFIGLPDPAAGPLSGAGRVLADEDIEAMMTALGVNLEDLGASTTGTFVEDAAAFQTAVETFEAAAAEVFDLSEADIASYRTPTKG